MLVLELDGMAAVASATMTTAIIWTTVIFVVENKVFKLIDIISKDNFCCVAVYTFFALYAEYNESGPRIQQSQLVEFYCDEVASLISIYDCVPISFVTQFDGKYFIRWTN